MGFNEIVGKIDKFLNDATKQVEDALNGGLNSADSCVNGGIDSLRDSANNMVSKMGVKDYPKEESTYVSDGTDRLSGLGEAEPNTSIGNIIRPSVGGDVPVNVGNSGEFVYGNVEDGLTINNVVPTNTEVVSENKVNLEKSETIDEVKSDGVDLTKSDSVEIENKSGVKLSKD